MKKISGWIAIALLSAAMPAFAQTYNRVDARSSLGANDLVDWSQIANGTMVSDGQTVASDSLGVTGTVKLGQPGLRIDAGPYEGDWQGGFLNHEALLWTTNNGPLTILFSDLGVNGVYGVGSQVWFSYTPDREATIDLLGESNTILASYTYSTGSGPADNLGQAAFIGATSSTGNILGIRFNNASQGENPGDFAINGLSLKILPAGGGSNDGGRIDGVPEPGEWAAMGILGAGLAGLVLRKRRNG